MRGPQVFAGYWNRPDATADAFVDGWFRTGDVAVREPDGYRLLGRSSVDILKTGGEKVSALEIEEVYRTHPDVVDCAVVGIPDDEWGDRVCAAVVVRTGVRRRRRPHCASGARTAWRRPRSRASSRSSTTSPATPSARSSNPTSSPSSGRLESHRSAGAPDAGARNTPMAPWNTRMDVHRDPLRGRRAGGCHHARPTGAAQRLHRHDARRAARGVRPGRCRRRRARRHRHRRRPGVLRRRRPERRRRDVRPRSPRRPGRRQGARPGTAAASSRCASSRAPSRSSRRSTGRRSGSASR